MSAAPEILANHEDSDDQNDNFDEQIVASVFRETGDLLVRSSLGSVVRPPLLTTTAIAWSIELLGTPKRRKRKHGKK